MGGEHNPLLVEEGGCSQGTCSPAGSLSRPPARAQRSCCSVPLGCRSAYHMSGKEPAVAESQIGSRPAGQEGAGQVSPSTFARWPARPNPGIVLNVRK